jgi:hypothetical protein
LNASGQGEGLPAHWEREGADTGAATSEGGNRGKPARSACLRFSECGKEEYVHERSQHTGTCI